MGLVSRRPDFVTVGICVPFPIVEILAEQPEFPELIRDVLADIGDGSVGAHDDFAIVVAFDRAFARTVALTACIVLSLVISVLGVPVAIVRGLAVVVHGG